MLGERTWTSAMSGAATNTVAAGPGSLSAVPLLTSSVSVGASVGTSWLWPNARPDAPPAGGAGWPGGPATGGWIGTGAGAGGGTGVGACANCGWPGAAPCWPAPTSAVSDALTIGARGGMAASVGGIRSTAGLSSIDLASTGRLLPGMTAGAAMGDDAVIARTACSARSASRRLRSSETLSVGLWRDTAFLAGAGGAILGAGRSGSLIWTCASSSEGWSAKASDTASASDEPARRQAGALDAEANDGLIAARSLECG